jgi:queuine tRNA-ribosyltransferase
VSLGYRLEAADGAARAGVITTAHNEIPTPMFMPVGTRGSVRTVDSADLERLDAPIILGNTYHLMLRPGADVVADLGGLHGFMDWGGSVLTDSGGYQVFSLEPKITDEGATFRSTYDGTTHLLTPESAVDIQVALGSDIQMVLDVCSPLPASRAVLAEAVDQTARWAQRARRRFLHHRTEGFAHGVPLSQFGIVQGGADPELRRDSARSTVDIGFEGYAVGGLSVGEERTVMLDALDAVMDHLPADRPRYLMGVGDPIGIIEAVARGVDIFDCVLPTRLARHGTALTDQGRLNVSRAEFVRSDAPLAADGPASRYSLGYLRHLFKVGEASAARLLTLHNLWWLLGLVRRARTAIQGGTFASLQGDIHQVWDAD